MLAAGSHTQPVMFSSARPQFQERLLSLVSDEEIIGQALRQFAAAWQVIKTEIVLWTAGFVLMTLLINAPLLPLILRKTGLSAGENSQGNWT